MCSGGGEAVDRLTAALDDLAHEDLSGLFGPALLQRVGALLPAVNRLAAEAARTVHEAQATGAAEFDGVKSMAAWLRGHGGLSPSAAAQLVRNGHTLDQLPAVAAAAARGALTPDQVALLAPVVTPANLAAAQALDVDLAAVDATFAELAATRPHSELAAAVHHYLERLDPDGPEPDPTEGRSLHVARHPDGSLTLRGELDPIGGEKVQAAIESIVQASRPAGDDRSRAQQQGDALVQLCDNQLASGNLPILRKNKPHVFLTIGLNDLLDPAPNPGVAQTGFGATLSAARARWAACDADLTRIVLDPDGMPLDYGRTLRLVPAGLRNLVVHRDKHCVFAGCDAPHYWCDLHHLVEWALGGETSLDNSALLCERHHTKLHHGYRVERQPDGRWRTWRPDGTEIHLIQPRQPDQPLARAG
jgi:uncharacterized protein DUF222